MYRYTMAKDSLHPACCTVTKCSILVCLFDWFHIEFSSFPFWSCRKMMWFVRKVFSVWQTYPHKLLSALLVLLLASFLSAQCCCTLWRPVWRSHLILTVIWRCRTLHSPLLLLASLPCCLLFIWQWNRSMTQSTFRHCIGLKFAQASHQL